MQLRWRHTHTFSRGEEVPRCDIRDESAGEWTGVGTLGDRVLGVFRLWLWKQCPLRPHLNMRNLDLSPAKQRLRIHPGGEPTSSLLRSSAKSTPGRTGLAPERTLDDHSLGKKGQVQARVALAGWKPCFLENPHSSGEFGCSDHENFESRFVLVNWPLNQPVSIFLSTSGIISGSNLPLL